MVSGHQVLTFVGAVLLIGVLALGEGGVAPPFPGFNSGREVRSAGSTVRPAVQQWTQEVVPASLGESSRHEPPGRVQLVQATDADVAAPGLRLNGTEPAQPHLPPSYAVEQLRPGFRAPAPDYRAERLAAENIAERIDPQLTIDLEVGRPMILRLKRPPVRDQVADPELLDVLEISESEYSLTAREPGATVLNFWFPSPTEPGATEVLTYLVRAADNQVARARDVRREQLRDLLTDLELEINRAFPNSAVRLTQVGTQVLVRGQARDIEEANAILSIVTSNVPQYRRPFDPANGVDGDALDPETADGALVETQVQQTASQLTPDGFLTETITTTAPNLTNNRAGRGNSIINLLEIGGVHQVMLKVTVAEVNRSAARSIGADLTLSGLDGVQLLTNLLGPGGAAATGASLIVNRADFDLVLNALKNLNLARSLAEPTLTTLNGQPANFQVGGSFPVPVVTGQTQNGLQGVQFQNFGVSLQFTPTVTDNDRIRLQLNAQVSTRDEAAGTQIGTANVPGLNQRQFSNTVELRAGQTLAVAGLIQNNLGANSNRVPWLGDMPYVGRIFSNDRTSYDEQELIVLVTPYLAGPIAEECRPPLPGSDYFEPTDWEFFVKGRLDGRRAEDFRSPVRDTRRRIKAYRHVEQRYIIGGVGHSNGRSCPPGVEEFSPIAPAGSSFATTGPELPLVPKHMPGVTP
ncbi:MAG: pilus assembly protein N-terminal domain-containing protein [Planctomycetaceae bacterium]